MNTIDSQAEISVAGNALLTLFYQRAQPARVVYPIAALLLSGFLAIVMPWKLVLAWLAAVGLASLLHGAVERAYFRSPSLRGSQMDYPAFACALAYGCVWASSFALFWSESPETQRQLALMITAALGVASVPACAPYRLAFVAWFMPVSAVFLYALLAVEEPVSWELIVTWLLYAALLGYAVWQQHGLVRENLRLSEQYQLALRSVTLGKEEAERANLSKARFLAAASHDLRQPMQALSMFVEGLETTDLHADQRQLVTQIRKSVGAITDSLREILDISKLDAGVVQPRIDSFPIAQILERIALELRNFAARKGLAFEVMRSRCWVASDPLLLYRIVLNLAQNAITYTDIGQGAHRLPSRRRQFAHRSTGYRAGHSRRAAASHLSGIRAAARPQSRRLGPRTGDLRSAGAVADTSHRGTLGARTWIGVRGYRAARRCEEPGGGVDDRGGNRHAELGWPLGRAGRRRSRCPRRTGRHPEQMGLPRHYGKLAQRTPA